MGKPVAGEIVIIPFPQTDLVVGKRRPALVLVDLPGDDLILCQITSRARSDGFSIPLDATILPAGNSVNRASFVLNGSSRSSSASSSTPRGTFSPPSSPKSSPKRATYSSHRPSHEHPRR